jgi:hypothetical protein
VTDVARDAEVAEGSASEMPELACVTGDRLTPERARQSAAITRETRAT